MVGLRSDITIVPTGGLDNVVTFVALLGASGLKLAVLHDYRGTSEQKLDNLVRQKLLANKALFNVSQFRDLANLGVSSVASDIEDLWPVPLYLQYFNATFAAQLAGLAPTEADLTSGDRIVERLNRYLSAKGVQLRPSGGFNHFAVASRFAAAPPTEFDQDTAKRFAALFSALNSLY